MILDEEEFLERFETCRLSGDDFHHADHVRLAWLYLQRHSLLAALTRFSEGLKRFAVSKGKATLYHETITWAYFFLIHERIKRSKRGQNWQEFAETNSDLLEWKSSILKKYYSDELLPFCMKSKVVRQFFLR